MAVPAASAPFSRNSAEETISSGGPNSGTTDAPSAVNEADAGQTGTPAPETAPETEDTLPAPPVEDMNGAEPVETPEP